MQIYEKKKKKGLELGGDNAKVVGSNPGWVISLRAGLGHPLGDPLPAQNIMNLEIKMKSLNFLTAC